MDELAPRTFFSLEKFGEEAERKREQQEEMESDVEDAKKSGGTNRIG